MKELLCCILCVAVFCTGCASRNTAPASSEPLPSESAVSDVPTTADENSATSHAPSKPEKEFPAPELSEMERTLLDNDIAQFAAYFSTIESLKSTADLDPEKVLFFTMSQIDRQKEISGYLFETNEDKNLMIPSDLVAENAKRLFGLNGFACKDSKTYDADSDTYAYSPVKNSALSCKVSAIKGAADVCVAYDATFYQPDDTAQKTPLRTTRYLFRLLRLNGMPYLQLVSITPAS